MNKSVYRRPDKPLKIAVRQRREAKVEYSQVLPTPLMVDSLTECHVTPPNIASLMAEYLCCDGMEVLEPQGGTGSLVHAALVNGAESVVCVERHASLYNYIVERFLQSVQSINGCFLEFSEQCQRDRKRYSRILTNPPFKAVKKHIAASLDLLDSNGIMIALVPIAFSHPLASDLELLPETTFVHAKVRTKIVIFEK